MTRLNKTEKIAQSRRQFLIGSVGTGLVMAFAPVLSAYSSESAASALNNKHFSPTVWFEIDHTGAILVNISRAEMGQHVGTAIARIVADELGANWDKVSIKHVDTDPKWGYMVTGGSWSVWQSYLPMSQAGAAGRTVLIEAAAQLLGVQTTECKAQNSQVVCGDKSISFADIISKGKIDRTFSADELAKFPPKDPNTRQLVSKPSNALDIPAKSTGTAKYGIDVEIEGMVYARPLVPPTRYGSKVRKVNDEKAKKVKGYLGYEILQDPSNILQGWVSVLADTYYGAVQSADAIQVEYQAGETSQVSEQDLINEGEKLVADKTSGGRFVDHGDIDNIILEIKST